VTFSRRRIGREEAEQLLQGITTSADRGDLLRLLSLASAPARPEELTGREPALAAFRKAPVSVPAPARRRVWTVVSRALVVKLLAGFGVLVLGGAAVAASTGNLPAQVQHGAHDLLSPLGVPVPDASVSHNPRPHGATPAPATSTGATTSANLCQAWHAEKKDNQGRKMDPAARQALTQAAGGPDKIPDYCAKVLGPGATDPSPAPAPSPTTTPKAHPDPHPSKSKNRTPPSHVQPSNDQTPAPRAHPSRSLKH
jgi:hypothetical protein